MNCATGILVSFVGIVLQQVFATEHPLVPLLRVGGESRPEAVPAVLAAEIEAVRHVRPHLDALHLRQTPLGVRLPCKRASDAMIIAMYFLMVSVFEVR